jgi:hypothetical protein
MDTLPECVPASLINSALTEAFAIAIQEQGTEFAFVRVLMQGEAGPCFTVLGLSSQEGAEALVALSAPQLSPEVPISFAFHIRTGSVLMVAEWIS